MPKIAITGKGGVGKTTLAALLAHLYAVDGYRVIAIDADPAASLASALGIPEEVEREITPIAAMEDLIFERTGAKPGSIGGFFKLNPRVDDIPDRFSVEHDGIRMLQLGMISTGGTGCICPESAMLKALVTHLVLFNKEILIMDMEAGVEHLGRATAKAVDAFLIVVEPGRRSLNTAENISRLAKDIGVESCYVVGNKVRGEKDMEYIRAHSGDIPVLGFLPADPAAVEADLERLSIYKAAPKLVEEARLIYDRLGEMAE